MLKKYAVLAATTLLLAACGPARNPGFVCDTDCAHYCQDGIKGDQCRRDIQLQRQDNARDEDGFYDANGNWHQARPHRDSFYDSNGYYHGYSNYRPDGSYDHDGYYDRNGEYHFY